MSIGIIAAIIAVAIVLVVLAAIGGAQDRLLP